MPGIGKTQLLLRYAKVSWDQHLYSHIVWISAASVDRITQGISGILDLIEHPDGYLPDQTAKLKTARLWLERYEGGDWLLIFDNVQNETLEFLSANLPLMNERGNILFSTRTAGVAELLVNAAGDQHQSLELRSMELRETADLLFADAGIDAAMVTPSLSSQAEDLVKRVGRLPLAVVQAASFIKQTHSTLDNILELYKSEHKIEIIQWENNLSRYEEISVARTILTQINELSRQSGNLENLLKLLSFLDPENIPVELIVDGAKARLQHQPEDVLSQSKRSILRIFKEWSSQKKSHTTSNTNAVTTHLSPEFDSLITLIVSPIEFQTAIQKLQSLSLIERRSRDGASSLWVHDLIQFMVRDHTKKDGTYEAWLRSSWSLVYAAFCLIEDPTLPQCWARCEMFLPHLQSLRNTWNDFGGTNLEVTFAIGWMARYFDSGGRYTEAGALFKLQLEERQNHHGTDHPDTLSSNNLAYVYLSQGRYDKAEELHKQALKGKEKNFGIDNPHTFVSMNNLASVYSLQGRFDEAEVLHKRVLEGTEKNLGTDHPDTLSSMNNFAQVYKLQGRYDEAEELHKRALEGSKKSLGDDHPHTLLSMNNLANVYSSQRRFDEAGALHKRVLEERKKSLGDDHPHTLLSMNNLAYVYSSQGRHGEAEELYSRVQEGGSS